MDLETRYKHYKETEKLIDNRTLGDALAHMQKDMEEAPDWDSSKELDDIKETFKYMLEYMQKGIVDDERDILFCRLLKRAYQLNDRLLETYRSQRVDDYLEILKKELKTNSFPSDMPSLLSLMRHWGGIMKGVEVGPLDNPAGDTEVIRKYEAFYSQLFVAIITNRQWTKDDVDAALEMLDDSQVYQYDVLLAVSAVNMALCIYYDENKLRFLFEVVIKSHDNAILARAVAGIVFCFLRHQEKVVLNHEFADLVFEKLVDMPVFIDALIHVQEELLICQQTDATTKKMDEDIIPAMMKSTYFRPVKFGFQDLEDGLDSADSDPDITKNGEWKEVEKKLQEITKMHVKGLDVYMTTFSHLKNFPFFNTLANWFYPFNPYHYAVKGVYFGEGKQEDKLASILKKISFCDSDKYSFCMLLGKIATRERKTMESKIIAEAGDEEMTDLLMEKSAGGSLVLELRSYLQGLYRFFKLCPSLDKALVFNPFLHDVNFLHYEVLHMMIGNELHIMELAETIYKLGIYKEALVYFHQLVEDGVQEPFIYQREGYCLQSLQRYDEAVEAYLKADLIESGKMWNYRQLAYCYRHMGDYKKALLYYEKIGEKKPDDKFVLLRTGECLLQLKRYEEALQKFYKVEYQDPEYLPALRAIAWCEFLSGDVQRALYYNLKIHDLALKDDNLPTHPEMAIDFLNAGHAALMAGKMDTAIMFYKFYAECSGTTDFHEFWDDFPIIEEVYDVSKDEMALVLEAVKA